MYQALQTTAQSLISEFGRSVTLRRTNPGAYNAATHSHSGGSTVDRTVMAVFTAYKQTEIDGTIIQRGDSRVLIAGYEPIKGDQIIDGTDVYNVIERETVKPGDVALLWKAQARK